MAYFLCKFPKTLMNHEIVYEVSTWKAESLMDQTFPVLIDNLAFQLSKYIPVPWRLEDIEEQMISLYFHQFNPIVNPLPHGRKTHHGGGCARPGAMAIVAAYTPTAM